MKSEPANTKIELPVPIEKVPSSPPIINTTVEDTCPSTPMAIMDSSDEEDDLDYTPQNTDILQPASALVLQSNNLIEEPIQVPRSPASQHETQQSHSSKAEQQLQKEWFSYSQYVNTNAPQSSSMHVAHDKFSYDATPKLPLPSTQYHDSAHPMSQSQATTIDEDTPRRSRIQYIPISANTTPHKIDNPQLSVSPCKLPLLFVPSSFPSPTKVRMEEWSSPVLETTQNLWEGGYGASLEDFSIPPPPPSDDG